MSKVIIPGTENWVRDCSGLKGNTLVYLNAYQVQMHYGGPEEGGWWWNSYSLKASRRTKLCRVKRSLEIIKDKLEKKGLNCEKRTLSNVNVPYVIAFRLESNPGNSYPKGKPSYE